MKKENDLLPLREQGQANHLSERAQAGSVAHAERWIRIPQLRAVLERSGEGENRLLQRWLSPAERQLLAAKKARWVERAGARLALRLALRQLEPTIDPCAVELTHDEWGRPLLKGALPPGEWLVSLSHDATLAVAFVAWSSVGPKRAPR